jgi:hypothetical protein
MSSLRQHDLCLARIHGSHSTLIKEQKEVECYIHTAAVYTNTPNPALERGATPSVTQGLGFSVLVPESRSQPHCLPSPARNVTSKPLIWSYAVPLATVERLVRRCEVITPPSAHQRCQPVVATCSKTDLANVAAGPSPCLCSLHEHMR